MEIEKQLAKLEEVIQWQDQKIDGMRIPSDERTRIVAGLINLALEHEKAIGILVDRKLYGSVFALIRPLFEAYIRAAWLRYCADESDIEKFKKGKLEKTIHSQIEEIEKVEGYDVGVLSDIKAKNWKLMNDFTHGGISQAISQNTPGEITSNYPEKDILGAIDFSISIGLWATMEIASIASNEQFAREILEKVKRFKDGFLK